MYHIPVVRLGLVVLLMLLWSCKADGQPETRLRDLARDRDAVHALELEAQEQLAQCMLESGFNYEPYAPNVSRDGPEPWESPIVLDLETARRRGYGFTAERVAFLTSVANDPNTVAFEALPSSRRDEYLSALEDGEAGGCRGEAYAKTFGASSEAAATVDRLLQEYFEVLLKDSRLQELNASWAECMARVGHEFQSPPQAREAAFEAVIDGLAPAEIYPSPATVSEVRSKEVRLAVVDAGCQQDLTGGYLAIEREHELHFVRRNEAILEQARNLPSVATVERAD